MYGFVVMYELVLLDVVGAVIFVLTWDNAHSISYHLIHDPWFAFLLSAVVLAHAVHIAVWSGDWIYETGAVVGAVGWLVLLAFNDQSYVSTHYLGVAMFAVGIVILCARVLVSPADMWPCIAACAFSLLALVTMLASVAFAVLLWVDKRGPATWPVERAAFLGVMGLLAMVSVAATAAGDMEVG